jgi:dienelactone hydrolase
MRRVVPAVLLLLLACGLSAPSSAAEPQPGDPAYVQRDLQNIADAYGRIDGAGGQLHNPAYLPALVAGATRQTVDQLLTQVTSPTRLALTAGSLVPGWNVGNPLRAGWNGTRGVSQKVAFTNRYGALLRGTVYKPKRGARDPYTGRRLTGPFPGVVITEGSLQGSEGMYVWLAQDLAERGYVVLTFDVQGQGTSETLPHEESPLHQDSLPFCNPLAKPRDGELLGCPGVPSQQLSNFVVGTEDALGFFTSTPHHRYPNEMSTGASTTTPYNPYWRSFNHSPDPRTATPGRTERIAIIGHSLGAAAVSRVQATDRRVATVVALDKLQSADTRPRVPALAVQSEYFLTPAPILTAPDPRRERRTGYDAWRRAGHDAMLVVPRASTHLEYTDIPLVLPASRYGQDLTSVYVQRWLDRYLKHRPAEPLLARSFRYLEPTGNGHWSPVHLERDRLLSFYYCSAYAIHTARGLRTSPDLSHAGC